MNWKKENERKKIKEKDLNIIYYYLKHFDRYRDFQDDYVIIWWNDLIISVYEVLQIKIKVSILIKSFRFYQI